jgi:tetratricopeptide (TPR) repeat protein
MEHTGVCFFPEGHHTIQTLASGIHGMKQSRRRLLQHLFGLAGGALMTPQALFDTASLERLAEAFVNPSFIDDTMLAHLETITKSHWRLFLHATSKGDLLTSFWGHLQTVLQFLKSPQSGAVRNRLYSVAGESAQMIGEILFDMQDYHHAQACYDFSIYAAKEAGNNALRAVGLGRLSFLPIYRDEPLQASPLLQEAKQLLMFVPRPLIHCWLAVVEAEVVAHLHDEVACEKALERATVNYSQEGSEEDRLWTRFNDATIPGYTGACYLQLHQPQKALAALRETLTSLPEYSPRHRSVLLADMAAAMQQMQEIEEACTLLHQTLEITTQTKSLMVLMRLEHVRKELEPWKETPSVKQLDTSINEILPRIMT